MEYPSAHDFYCHSNTHDPNQDGFHDLYWRDFIHALSQVAQHKLSCHQLDPYQYAAFQHSIVCRNVGEEEANLTLEIAMEYAGVLGTIIFDESCHLCDLMEAQVRRNQFAMDVVVDWLDERINEIDSRVDHMSERLLALEGKVTNMEAGYTELLALGWEQVEMSAQSCWALANLAAIAVAQQQKICEAEERMDAMREIVIVAGLWSASLGLAFNPNDHASRYSVWFPLDSNPQPGFSASSGISGWSAGVRVSMGAGHVMAYTAIGLR